MEDVGFPDFEQPYFFNDTSLAHSNLDRVSARYEAQAITPWLANLSLTAHYQRTERLLRTTLPVQFPAPTPVAFFPITVMRLDILSDTEQRVSTPGVDLHAVFVPAQQPPADDRRHLLSRQQQRPAHDHDDHVDGRTGGARRAGAGGRAAAVARAAGAGLDCPSRARARRQPARHRRVRPGRVARAPDAVGDRRPARRLLHRDHRSHARLRRDQRHRQRHAGDRSGDAARRRGRHLLPQGADRRHRPGLESRRRRQPVRPLRPQLSPSQPRGDAVRRPGDGRQHRAERDGEARDRQQLRCRREVPRRQRVGRRLLLPEPVPGLHRPGPGGGDQRRRAR